MYLHGQQQQQQQSLGVNCVLESDFICMSLELLEEGETEGMPKKCLSLFRL